MKNTIAPLALLVLAAACSAPPTNRNVAVPANRASETKPATIVSLAEMETREKATWEALEKKDYDTFANYLASDYLEVGEDAVFDKTTLVNGLKDLITTDATFADWKMLAINKDAVILMYEVTIKGSFKGHTIPPGPYRASSAWVNRDGKWLAIYYQQTAIKAAPAAPSLSASQPEKAANPAKLADAGPDPIANEKIVWESFKSKNYDGFAALLVPEFVEVTSDGVYDKAGSVKGVSMFDASKTELSDWKAINLNANAALVNYVVTSPGGPAERHSTIWVNRDGKWLGLFHQGTPQAAPVKK